MYKNVKQGWYRILNEESFVKPIDDHMKSYKDGHVNYKSGLELMAIRYCDFNNHIVKWSLEPFHIKYIKPITGKTHRYYIDLYIEFSTGEKFLVEVKSSNETIPPRVPSKKTDKAINNYKRAIITYSTNKAKWEAAEEFAKANGFRFIILTEKQLK